jgi:iron complex transport system substrate-binding protein
MAQAYRQLGKLLGLQDKAEELAKYCETDYSRTKEIMAQIGENGKVKLAYCIGADGLSVTAKGSYHAEIIDLLSSNVAVLNNPSSKGTGNQIDMEQLLKWNPDVIVFSTGSAYKTVGTDPTWNKLSAIKNGKYYEVPEGPYNWLGFPPAINSYLGMIWMAQLLYPNTAKYNMYEEAAKFYKLFYHADLTKEQYSSLTANSLGKIK